MLLFVVRGVVFDDDDEVVAGVAVGSGGVLGGAAIFSVVNTLEQPQIALVGNAKV